MKKSHGEKREETELLKLLKKIAILISSLLMIYVFSKNVATLSFINGDSMKPYVSNKGVVVTITGSFELERYSVYIIRIPDDTNYRGKSIVKQHGIKRLIGLPNDELQFIDGTIYINGNKIIDDYDFPTDSGYDYNNKIIYLKEDEYFFVGDNRNESVDSREFGVVCADDVIGKVVNVIYKGE